MKQFFFLLLIFGIVIGSKRNGFCTLEEHKVEERKDVREPELDSLRITANSRIFEHLPKGPTDHSETVEPKPEPAGTAPLFEPGEIYIADRPGQPPRKLSPKEKADYLKRLAEAQEEEARKKEKEAQEAEEEAKKAEQEMQKAEAKHREEDEDILSSMARFFELGIGPRNRVLQLYERLREEAKKEYEEAKRKAERRREEANKIHEMARETREQANRAQEEAAD